MKLQIDTTNKTIKIEEPVNLKELTDLLEKLLPKGEWKEFKLEPQIIVNWNNPIIIEKELQCPSPYQQPWITCDVAGTGKNEINYTLNPGVYNIEN